MYKIENETLIRRVSDGAYIPMDPANVDYVAYLVWAAAGNEPEPNVPTDEEVAASVRANRDARLTECDWSQLADVPNALRESWATYRQALRDIPQQPGFPHRVEWPASPDAN
jgi:hypothetical protein